MLAREELTIVSHRSYCLHTLIGQSQLIQHECKIKAQLLQIFVTIRGTEVSSGHVHFHTHRARGGVLHVAEGGSKLKRKRRVFRSDRVSGDQASRIDSPNNFAARINHTVASNVPWRAPRTARAGRGDLPSKGKRDIWHPCGRFAWDSIPSCNQSTFSHSGFPILLWNKFQKKLDGVTRSPF